MKKAHEILIKMGFTQVVTNHYYHKSFGYVLLQGDFNEFDVARSIFEAGRRNKADEIKTVLQIQTN